MAHAAVGTIVLFPAQSFNLDSGIQQLLIAEDRRGGHKEIRVRYTPKHMSDNPYVMKKTLKIEGTQAGKRNGCKWQTIHNNLQRSSLTHQREGKRIHCMRLAD